MVGRRGYCYRSTGVLCFVITSDAGAHSVSECPLFTMFAG